MMDNKKILVIGVGNLLLADEGVGIHIISHIKGLHLPPHIEIVDGGTGSFELINHFKNKEKVIIVDAIKANEEPGTVVRFKLEEVNFKWNDLLSSHQLGLRELFHFSQGLKPKPEIIIYGIVPQDINSLCPQLSDTVRIKIPKIVAAILEEISIPQD
ncbi:hydrogenase maturation protease [Bacteroidota bacterium]